MDLTRIALPVFLLCVSPVWARVLSLTDMYGTLQSPNFPESYPTDVELQWNISVPDGYQIRLYFMQFDLEPSYLCEYDYVKVFSGAEELAVFCGRENTDTERVPAGDVIVSPGNMLSVAFRSDFSNEERYSGFEAHYSAMDIDECSDKLDEDLACDHLCHNYIGGYYCSCRYGHQLHSDNRTCKVECSDSVYTERSGLITSPDFPRPYPKSSDCLYQIKLEEGFAVSLDFDVTIFDIEDHPDVLCPYDHIKIKAGERVFGPFCGGKSPGRIQTDSNTVSVLFHSDNSGENKGWKLSYSSAGSKCPVPLLPPHSRAEPVQSLYFLKEHLSVTCEPGYSLQKDGEEFDHYQIECQADGTWSSSLPICRTVDCGPVDASSGEVLYNSSSNSTTFGSRILYGCTSSPGDHSSYVCDQSGLWIKEDGTPLTTCQSDHENSTKKPTEAKKPSPTASAQPACGEESQPFPSQQKRIVGGRTAFPGLFPWQVLLHVEDVSRVPAGHWYGSGALLSPSWVLTAAHVLRTPRRDLSVVPVAPEHVRATLGITDIRDSSLAVNRSVDRLILHRDFDPRNYDNDIALVRLSQEVALNKLVRPVCLPPARAKGQASSPLPNTLGVVAGWGISMANASASASDLGVVSEVLQYVKLPVVAQEECKASYTSRSANYNITDNMFCAGFYEGGRDTCLGDSGGAFVIKDSHSGRWVVQGLVSWGGPEECGSRQVYGVYTRVANYANWLRTTMDTECWP